MPETPPLLSISPKAHSPGATGPITLSASSPTPSFSDHHRQMTPSPRPPSASSGTAAVSVSAPNPRGLSPLSPSLGAMFCGSTKSTTIDYDEGGGASCLGERIDKGERSDRNENCDRYDRSDRSDRADRGERSERGEQSDRGECSDQADRSARAEKLDRVDRLDKDDGDGRESVNPQQFCLRWNNYQTNLTIVFDQLLQNESFVDVTLACDGNSIKAHKIVLSACSPYFQSLFVDNPCQHPIIIMRDVKWHELKAVVEFMYKGEINVSQEQIGPLLRVAEMLKIRGLADVNGDSDLTAQPTTVSSANTTTKTARAPVIATVSKTAIASKSSSPLPEITPIKKQRITPRSEWNINNLDLIPNPAVFAAAAAAAAASSRESARNHRKRRWPSASSTGTGSPVPTSPDQRDLPSPKPANSSSSIASRPSTTPIPPFSIPPPLDAMTLSSLGMSHADDLEIKPGIAEMIREEERVCEFRILFNTVIFSTIFLLSENDQQLYRHYSLID